MVLFLICGNFHEFPEGDYFMVGLNHFFSVVIDKKILMILIRED